MGKDSIIFFDKLGFGWVVDSAVLKDVKLGILKEDDLPEPVPDSDHRNPPGGEARRLTGGAAPPFGSRPRPPRPIPPAWWP